MNKQRVVCPHSGILFSSKRKINDNPSNLDKSQVNYAKKKKEKLEVTDYRRLLAAILKAGYHRQGSLHLQINTSILTHNQIVISFNCKGLFHRIERNRKH